MSGRRCRAVTLGARRQRERLAWLDWLLSDPEAGRYFSGQRLARFQAERDQLRRALGREQ